MKPLYPAHVVPSSLLVPKFPCRSVLWSFGYLEIARWKGGWWGFCLCVCVLLLLLLLLLLYRLCFKGSFGFTAKLSGRYRDSHVPPAPPTCKAHLSFLHQHLPSISLFACFHSSHSPSELFFRSFLVTNWQFSQ